MNWVSQLPLVNACLNGLTIFLLLGGLAAILRGKKLLHLRIMTAAVAVSAVFLASYLIHKFAKGPTYFQHQGAIRWIYFAILGTHTVLAIVNLPFILRLLWLARRGDFDRHRRLARWVWPVWMYVSVTGVLVYLILYRWFPAAGG